MKLSRRSAVDDAPSPLATAMAKACAERSDIIDLTLSNPTRAGLSYAAYDGMELRARSAAHGEGRLLDAAYDPDPLGLESARHAIVRHWPGARPPEAEHVLLLPSSSEAYHYLFTLLCDEGDSVLMPEPSYPLLAHLAKYSGVRLEPYRIAYDGAWHIDLDSVRRARSERTRAIVLISPNNPTGSYTTETELCALAELGLPLISDEVFARYAFEPTRSPASALHLTDALTFCIDGLSKSAGLPQAKLSWIGASGPAPLLSEAYSRLAWLADTYLSVAGSVQRLLPEIMSSSARFRAPLLERLRQNRAALQRALEGSAASVLHAEGGWYAIVRLPALAAEEDWVLSLLERHGVLTHPGHFYDLDEATPHLVVSLLVSLDQMQRGARAIRDEALERTRHSG